jgi:hypothetical protein
MHLAVDAGHTRVLTPKPSPLITWTDEEIRMHLPRISIVLYDAEVGDMREQRRVVARTALRTYGGR